MSSTDIADINPESNLKTLADFRYQLRKFLSFSEAAAERYGIGAQHYQLMQVIAAIPEDQEASVTYLAERMVLRHNSTVELVDRAERAGLVKRDTDPRDMRRSLVTLLPHGRAILMQLVAEHMDELIIRTEPLIASLRALQTVAEPQHTRSQPKTDEA